MSHRRATRRTVLKAAVGTLAVPYAITSTALGAGETPPASQRITIGHIGVGGRGRALFRDFQRCQGAQSVAVADPYQDRREAIAKPIGAKVYNDFRDLVARDGVDGVVVATPDHWHVPIANAAARAKKDAYVEKPLGLSIEQDLVCRKVFKENRRVFQYGTQQRSSTHCRFGCELIRNGRIGKVERIEVIAPDGGEGGSTEEAPVPEGLDYNMWIGPAPMVPYTNSRCVTPGTYWIYDYSIGYLAGWGAHPLDIMVWGSDADLSGLIEIEGSGVIPTQGLYNAVIHWEMKGKLGDVEFSFKPGPNSTKFIGPDGWIEITRKGIDAEPKSLLESPIAPDETGLIESRSQQQNFIDSIRSRHEAVSPINDAVRSDVISHLCDIAVRTGRKITWDPAKEAIVGDAEASKMLTRPMREPWTL